MTDWRTAWERADPAARRRAMRLVSRPGQQAGAKDRTDALLAAGWARRQREQSWRAAAIGAVAFLVAGLVTGFADGPLGVLRTIVTGAVFVAAYGPLSRNLAIARERAARAHYRRLWRRDPPWPEPPESWSWRRIGAIVGVALGVGTALILALSG